MRVLALDIGDGDEGRLELAVVVQQVEVLLIGLHGGDQTLRRHFQEALVEGARQCHRPFHEAVDLVEQGFLDDGVGTIDFCLGLDLFADTLTTHLTVGQHAGAFQRVEVVLGVRQRDACGAWKR